MNNQNKELMEKYLEGNKEIVKPLDFEDDEVVEIKAELTKEELVKKYLGDEIKTPVKPFPKNINLDLNNEGSKVDNDSITIEKNSKVIPFVIHNNSLESPVEIKENQEDLPIEIEENQEDLPIKIEDDFRDKKNDTTIDAKKEEYNLEPITLDEEINLPEPADLMEIVENLPETETNMYEAINEIQKEEALKDIKEEEIFIEEKKDNKIKRIVVGILLGIILIVAVLLSVLYVYNANYKSLLIKSFNHLKKYNNQFMSNIDADLTNYNLKGNMEISSNSDLLKEFEKASYEYDLIKSNQDSQADFNVIKNGQTLLGLDLVVKDFKGYVLLKEIYENYIEIGEAASNTENITNEDIVYTAKRAYDIFVESIKKESYNSETSKIEINNKSVQARKTIIRLTEKEILEIAKEIVKQLENEKQSKQIAEYINNNIISNINENQIGNGIIEYSIYSKGIKQEIIGIDLKIVREVEDYDAWYTKDCSLTDENCYNKIPKKEQTTLIEYRNSEEPIINVYVDEKLIQAIKIKFKGNITTIEFNNQLDTIGTIIITKNALDTKISIDMSRKGLVFTLILDTKIEEIKKQEEYNINLNYQLKIKSDSENLTLNLISKNKLNTTETNIKKPSDVVEYEELPLEKQEEITEKLMRKIYELLNLDKEYYKEDDYYYED